MRAGSERLSQASKTRNISSGGVLFASERQLEIGGPIEYTVTLLSGSAGTVSLRCMGKVIRIEKTTAAMEAQKVIFNVAATLERYEFTRSNMHAN